MPTTVPPAPAIISILPEGSRVKAGDVVCELDSSTLRDALAVQQLRFVQAKAWVEQAKLSLEADQIALREFEAGILPQDIELVRQNIGICKIENEQAARNLAWARRLCAKAFAPRCKSTPTRHARANRDRAARRRGHARTARQVPGRRIIKSRKARIQAIQADLLSLESSFRLERERLKRIETMITNCTMRAPRDGIIVYANPSNGSGLLDTQIREGLIVHPLQPIFRLLDPHHIQVRAKINESQLRASSPASRS